MKIEVGKSYRTRDGQRARVIAMDAMGDYPVVALVKDNTVDFEVPESYTANGEQFSHGISDMDLVEEVKPRHTRYVIARPDFGYATEEEARRHMIYPMGNAALVKVTFEEGEGL